MVDVVVDVAWPIRDSGDQRSATVWPKGIQKGKEKTRRLLEVKVEEDEDEV